MELAIFPQRDKAGQLRPESVLLGVKHGVSHAVAALVRIQRRPGWEEAGVPCGLSRLLDIEEPPALVGRDAVIAVPQQPLELGVPVEAVAAHGVGDEAEEFLIPQIIDPRQGRGGGIDDILFPHIIEAAKFHEHILLI